MMRLSMRLCYLTARRLLMMLEEMALWNSRVGNMGLW